MLIQRLDGYALDDEDEKPSLYPSLYRSLLGRLIPRFAEEKSATGHYPERPQSPCLNLSGNQRLQPRYLLLRHNRSLLKLIKCLCSQQYRLQSPIQCLQLRRCSRRWSIPSLHHKPQPTRVQPPIQTPTASPKPMVTVLPNIQKSAKPYQDLLTDAIMAAAKQWVDKSQVITQITLKSNDGLTTAMVEQLFSSLIMPMNPTIPRMMPLIWYLTAMRY
ncbi:MAG: hypothetical protein U1E92_05135 [Moraxella osloensis]